MNFPSPSPLSPLEGLAAVAPVFTPDAPKRNVVVAVSYLLVLWVVLAWVLSVLPGS